MARRGHHEGSIYKRADGRWVAAISHKDATGRTKRVSRYATTRADACQKLRELQRQIEQGVQVTAKSPTLRAFLEQWLTSSVKPSVKPKTYEGYESIVRVRILPRIGGLKLTQITPPVIQSLYGELADTGLSARSIIHTHCCLHRALEQAVRWGLLVRNPCAVVDPPRTERQEMNVLTKDQVTRLLEVTRDHPMHALYVLAVTTGMRLGELLGLKWTDIDLDDGRLRVMRALQPQRGNGLVFVTPKTARSRRTVVLSQTATRALREHRHQQVANRLRLGPTWTDHDLVFPNETGGPIYPSSVSHGFKRVLRETDLPDIRFHDLRHTAATLLLGQGMHPKVVSEMLGHATITLTLDTYSHMVPVLHEQAAQAMDYLFGT